ncbi:MAG: STAS domain-containing protein [Acidimicrobiales bacterium]
MPTGSVSARTVTFAVRSVRQSDEVVVSVAGDVDATTAPGLAAELGDVVEETARIVVDLAQTKFIDSSGLAVLVVALKRARELGGDIVLRSPADPVRKVLDICGLDQLFVIS